MATIDYELQTNDFLKKTGTKFVCNFWTHDYYFPDDKQKRDIWYITLKNSKHSYRFTFGQSIINAGKAPTPYDVLASLTKYEVGDFWDFCSEYGYDPDLHSSKKTYKAVLKEWDNVNALFDSDELELLREIQ